MRLEATDRSYSWTSVTRREQMNMRGMNGESDVCMSWKEELEAEKKVENMTRERKGKRKADEN